MVNIEIMDSLSVKVPYEGFNKYAYKPIRRVHVIGIQEHTDGDYDIPVVRIVYENYIPDTDKVLMRTLDIDANDIEVLCNLLYQAQGEAQKHSN